MEPKPVEQNRTPAYPTRREVLAGAASFALANLAGCGANVAGVEAESGRTSVAPVFVHGEGRGAMGCIVVSPPVFLSEEEGMQILREELAKHGIRLKAGGVLEGVRVPGRMEEYKRVDKGDGQTEFKQSIVELPDRAQPLELDGIDSNRKIAVEFVSHEDYHALGGPRSGSTVQGYDTKEVAEYVAARVKEQGKDRVFFVVFYDPMAQIPRGEPSEPGEKVDWRAAWKERMKRGKKESEKLLRQQAQDSIVWLKEQKVIS